jgi:hypothetical protein
MKKTQVKELIEKILTETALDPRIETGILDIYNHEHLDIMSEYMTKQGIDQTIISEFINNIAMEEGKYPERQAYNKDGWLVTFPSKEYKDAAIKKRTHFASDPTHGKGGMNLYYKKRGKQKRQTQQDASRVEPVEKPTAKLGVKPAPVQQPAKAAANQPTSPAAKPAAKPAPSPEDDSEEYYDDTSAASVEAEKEKLRNAFGFNKKEPAAGAEAPKPAQAPAIDVPVVTQPSDQYASVSKKFAKQKGWAETPYGEYRDGEGNPVAVIGLSGEVVPIRNTDREEYKIFAEKNMPQT